MPVRSSVCTYSPSSVSNSKYSSTVLPTTPSSLSVGSYKPLVGSSSSYTHTTRPVSSYGLPSSLSSGTSSGSGIGLSSSPGRYSQSSSYSPSSYTPSSYSSSSLSSTGSSIASSSSSPSSSSSYRPSSSIAGYRTLNSAYNSFSGRHGAAGLSATSSREAAYARFSSASSTGSTASSSSLGSNGLRDRSDLPSSNYPSISNYNYYSGRRLSTTSSSNESLPSGIPRGLVNLGNTCYMNAVLEALYSVDTFRNLLSRASHYDKALTSELADLFKQMKSSSVAVSPANFKYAFSRQSSRFSGLGQQDAQEFLRYLINGVHEESNQAARRPRRSVPPRAPTSAAEAWSQYREIVDDSPLVDVVVGQLCSTIVCSICSNKSYCWDPFWDLSLPLIGGRHSCRLADVVRDFIAKETLDADERPICSNCKKATRSTKQIELTRLPPVIILHLKKFSNDGYKLTSPEVKIDKTLTLNNRTSYNLKACISHHGCSASSGHYTSHCEYSSKWYHFNDDRVRDVTSTFNSDNLQDAYVLIYTQS